MGGKSSPSSVAPEHQRNENSVPFPACASEKSRSLFFRAVSLDRCTESDSGQQDKGRIFVPTLCEGVAFRYSLLHYPVSGCPPELRPCRWGLGDKLTGCSFVSLCNLWSGHNSVPISRKKAFLLRLHGRLFCPPSQAPQSRLAFPLVLFRKSRQNGSESSTRLFWGRVYARLDRGACSGGTAFAQK